MIKFTVFKKTFEFGSPQRKGVPLYVVFERNQNGIVKSMHEKLEEAKAQVAFGDTIVQYDASKRIELSFISTDLSSS